MTNLWFPKSSLYLTKLWFTKVEKFMLSQIRSLSFFLVWSITSRSWKTKKEKNFLKLFFLHKLVDPSQNKKLHLSDQKHLKTNSMNYYSTCLHILLDKLFHNKFHLLCFKTWGNKNVSKMRLQMKNRINVVSPDRQTNKKNRCNLSRVPNNSNCKVFLKQKETK